MARTYVALLRGINVGKAKRVAMNDLRAAMASLGYGDVRTLLASGNVVFTASRVLGKDAPARMQEALLRRTGVSSKFTVLAAAELEGVVAGNPWIDRITDPSRMFVGFLQSARDAALVTEIDPRPWKPDTMATGTRAVYLWCPNGLMESQLFELVGKALGDRVTVRNWGTTTKLAAMVAGD
jgi:uncharacterized protein (DUF1697 family)